MTEYICTTSFITDDYRFLTGEYYKVSDQDEYVTIQLQDKSKWVRLGKGEFKGHFTKAEPTQLSTPEVCRSSAAGVTTSAFDNQTGGSHYKDMKIQPMEYALANNLNLAQGNVVKYVSRYKNKNGLEDLKKAIHCLELLIEFEEEQLGKMVIPPNGLANLERK